MRTLPKDEIRRRGERVFATRIAPTLRSSDPFVAIDVLSGDFEIGPTERDAVHRLRARRPTAQTWLQRTDGAPVRSLGWRGGR